MSDERNPAAVPVREAAQPAMEDDAYIAERLRVEDDDALTLVNRSLHQAMILLRDAIRRGNQEEMDWQKVGLKKLLEERDMLERAIAEAKELEELINGKK